MNETSTLNQVWCCNSATMNTRIMLAAVSVAWWGCVASTGGVSCTVSQSLGCYGDSTSARLFPNEVTGKDDTLTKETCAVYVAQMLGAENMHNIVLGVEYANQCFYIDGSVPASATKQPDTDCNMTCAGNASETCGGKYRLEAYQVSCIGPPPPPNPGPLPTEGPCDILGAAGNPCVAAHSTVRALYKAYNGPLCKFPPSAVVAHHIPMIAFAEVFLK